MERGFCNISNNISIFCQFHACKQIWSSSYGSKVTTHFAAGNWRWLWPRRRVEVILMSGERSFRVIVADFDNWHPERLPISHNTVKCFISKFWETGIVADKARSGHPKSATDETHCQPQNQFIGIWKLSTWQCCVKLEVFLGAGC